MPRARLSAKTSLPRVFLHRESPWANFKLAESPIESSRQTSKLQANLVFPVVQGVVEITRSILQMHRRFPISILCLCPMKTHGFSYRDSKLRKFHASFFFSLC